MQEEIENVLRKEIIQTTKEMKICQKRNKFTFAKNALKIC